MNFEHGKPAVLIVGAGPTGLVTALWLTRAGIPVRLIDQASEPGTASRALVVHARTLEFYRQLGIDADLIESGVDFNALNYWVRGKRKAQFRFGDIGASLSPYPNILITPQDVHERILIRHLERLGVKVDRETEFAGLEATPAGVAARLRRRGRDEVCETAYLAGCDGAHSAVRHALDITFPGGTYSDVFYVADVELEDETLSRELHLSFEQADFLAVFPLREPKRVRLVGTLCGHPHDKREDLGWDDINGHLLERLRLKVARKNWFSTYRVHHRVADHFRNGNAFLLGDAAHVHSPVGGQGMNTGIGDAVNLAWKLADVLRGRMDASLLDTYEQERQAFALQLVATTDRAFTLATSSGAVARWVKMVLVPLVLPVLVEMRSVRRFMFRTVSQTRINYRESDLSVGYGRRVRPGDRLPWVVNDPAADDRADNFVPLRSRDWQVHVYGSVSPSVVAICREHRLPLRALPWSAHAAQAGLIRSVPYLVRPDGYIAFTSRNREGTELSRYIASCHLRFARPATAAARPLPTIEPASV